MTLERLAQTQTRLALFWMHLANEPFIALLTLVGFILKKELGASTLTLAFLATLTPACSLLSFFISSFFSKKEANLVQNLMLFWFLARVLFLILPFYSSSFFLVLAVFCYQLFNRSSTPALIEILRSNIEESKRTSIFSFVYFLSFLESLILGLFIGKILDVDGNSWKFLFAGFAVFSLTSLYFQKKIPQEPLQRKKLIQEFHPLKESLQLLKSDKSFAQFQLGFMLGGFGLMMMNPALITFYHENLNLSHETLSSCRYIWMSLGVLISTFLWQKYLNKETIFILSSLVIVGFSIFPLIVLKAQSFLFALFIAFFLYGIAQSGSHLIWHLSGSFFAQDDKSSFLYTSTNIFCVGVRGMIAPFLGGLMTETWGAMPTLMIGSCVCLSGAFFMLKKTPERLTA